MSDDKPLDLPPFLARRRLEPAEALRQLVTSGTRIGSGFATSEPHNFYASLWDHILEEDLTGIEIHQALFMAPHRLLVGDALDHLPDGDAPAASSLLGALRRRIGALIDKAEALNALVEHWDQLKERNIRILSGFMSPAINTVVPDKLLLRTLHPEWAGRNPARGGLVSWQSVHFPDAPDALLLDDDGRVQVDVFVCVTTAPTEDDQGRLVLSHGPANGANAEAVEHVLEDPAARLLIYINPGYPFTVGHPESPNTLPVEHLRKAADEGRVWVVEDDGDVPALPDGALAEPSAVERAIAEHVVNHIEMNADRTRGRALQVGIGGTGVQAVKALQDSSWRGRSYTEMLEPYTLDLFDAGKIEGTHFITADGRRESLDGKMMCTFALGSHGDGFYDRLDRHPAVLMSAASRVVISEAFYGGLGINNILGIDFHGHVNSSGRDRNPYSGVGGGAMIVRGLGRGGISYLCLKSTHRTPEGEVRSSIFPYLPQGTPVSLIGPDVMGTREGASTYLVTEHGVAPIHARDQHAFIRSLLSVAHPDHREELAEAAWEEFRVRV